MHDVYAYGEIAPSRLIALESGFPSESAGYDARLIEMASAVAAIVSQLVPGVLHSPTVAELERFLGSIG